MIRYVLVLAVAFATMSSGVPAQTTVADFDDLGRRAKAAVAAEDCAEAEPLLRAYAEQAERLSEMMLLSLDPFYRADEKTRRWFSNQSTSRIEAIREAEAEQNRLISERNEAWVERAGCLFALGETESGIADLQLALRHIPIEETDLWLRARDLLWRQIGYSAE